MTNSPEEDKDHRALQIQQQAHIFIPAAFPAPRSRFRNFLQQLVHFFDDEESNKVTWVKLFIGAGVIAGMIGLGYGGFELLSVSPWATLVLWWGAIALPWMPKLFYGLAVYLTKDIAGLNSQRIYTNRFHATQAENPIDFKQPLAPAIELANFSRERPNNETKKNQPLKRNFSKIKLIKSPGESTDNADYESEPFEDFEKYDFKISLPQDKDSFIRVLPQNMQTRATSSYAIMPIGNNERFDNLPGSLPPPPTQSFELTPPRTPTNTTPKSNYSPRMHFENPPIDDMDTLVFVDQEVSTVKKTLHWKDV